MRSIVITGGRGFVGHHLENELIEAWPDAEVITWDLPEVDITKPTTYEKHLQELQPQWVVHLAAFAAASQSFSNESLVYEVNVDGTRQLLEHIVETSPETRVLAVSSADIYGSTPLAAGGTPIPELPLNQCEPRNPYAESKVAMEQLIADEFADRTVIVRPFPHIGPGQKQGFVTADFASQIAAIERGEQEPMLQVGNLEAARDFTDVRDVVVAYRLLMEQAEAGSVFNIASGHAVAIQDVLDVLLGFSDTSIHVEQDADRLRPSDVPVAIGDSSQLRELTGWQPEIPLEQSLQDVMTWWREHANS